MTSWRVTSSIARMRSTSMEALASEFFPPRRPGCGPCRPGPANGNSSPCLMAVLKGPDTAHFLTGVAINHGCLMKPSSGAFGGCRRWVGLVGGAGAALAALFPDRMLMRRLFLPAVTAGRGKAEGTPLRCRRGGGR